MATTSESQPSAARSKAYLSASDPRPERERSLGEKASGEVRSARIR